MRAFIEHRGRYGFLGSKPRFTLYLHLAFSDEERAIVKARALQNYVFDLSPGYLATTERRHSKEFLGGIATLSAFAFLAAFPLMFVAAVIPALSFLPLSCLFGAPIVWWYAIVAARRESKAYTSKLSLAELISNPALAVQTDNPGQAPALEENIRARVAQLKQFLTKTHELASTRIFEL